MASVTARIKQIKQPKGGYIHLSEFHKIVINDGIILNPQENIHASVIGMAVDYLTRFILGNDKNDAFRISLNGAFTAELYGRSQSIKVADKLIKDINGLDETSVINACKLATFDVWYRNPAAALQARSYLETNPDELTIQNIQTLVKRSVAIFEKHGPIIKYGFGFEPIINNKDLYKKMIETGNGSFGGYTPTVSSGDGDFLTSDTLWEFKVIKSKPSSSHILQLIMYWIMGQHSGQEIFKNITKIAIFNPRLNVVYRRDMTKVSKNIIKSIEDEVICYQDSK